MPEICRFFGIVISMFYADRSPPHSHARYGEHRAIIEIESSALLSGSLPPRLLWANDFPHSDSTWPHSQALLAQHAAHLTDEERRLVLHDNVAELYGLAR